MAVKEKILCSKTHEYVYEDGANQVIGLTDYAIDQLGDIVFVELPEVGASYRKGEIFGTIESVKAASEMYMPISGVVTEINEELIEKPELLNESPFDEMWLIKINPSAYEEDVQDLTAYNTYKEEVE